MMIDNTRTRRYTSTRGITATFFPMPPLIRARIRQALMGEQPFPEKPTYEAEIGDGVETVVHEHDEQSVMGDPEAEQAWEEWKDAVIEWESEYNRRVNYAMRMDCMKLDLTEEEAQDWAARKRRQGIEVPDDPIDFKLLYIDLEFVGHQQDVVAITMIPMGLALEQPEVLRAAEDMFRSAALAAREGSEPTGAAARAQRLDVSERRSADSVVMESDADSARLEN